MLFLDWKRSTRSLYITVQAANLSQLMRRDTEARGREVCHVPAHHRVTSQCVMQFSIQAVSSFDGAVRFNRFEIQCCRRWLLHPSSGSEYRCLLRKSFEGFAVC